MSTSRDTATKTEINTVEHKCLECGRVYFNKFAGEYEEDCTDCIDEADSDL